MRRRLVWLALTLFGIGVVTAGCGSSSTSATNPPAASSAAASASSASESATPTASSSAASSGGSSANSLAITGAFQATAAQSSTQSQCSKSTFASGPLAQVMVVYDTSQAGPSSSYEVDLDNITPGTTTTFPTTQRNGAVGPMIRFSYNGGNGYLDWGYSAVATAGQPAGSAQGTVTMSATAQTGTFNLTVPFLGNDSRTIAAGSKPAIHISGKWSCT
jgi:hypothetical protein